MILADGGVAGVIVGEQVDLPAPAGDTGGVAGGIEDQDGSPVVWKRGRPRKVDGEGVVDGELSLVPHVGVEDGGRHPCNFGEVVE